MIQIETFIGVEDGIISKKNMCSSLPYISALGIITYAGTFNLLGYPFVNDKKLCGYFPILDIIITVLALIAILVIFFSHYLFNLCTTHVIQPYSIEHNEVIFELTVTILIQITVSRVYRIKSQNVKYLKNSGSCLKRIRRALIDSLSTVFIQISGFITWTSFIKILVYPELNNVPVVRLFSMQLSVGQHCCLCLLQLFNSNNDDIEELISIELMDSQASDYYNRLNKSSFNLSIAPESKLFLLIN